MWSFLKQKKPSWERRALVGFLFCYLDYVKGLNLVFIP